MRKWKGYGFFVAMAAIILIAMISSDFMSGWTEENYTYPFRIKAFTSWRVPTPMSARYLSSRNLLIPSAILHNIYSLTFRCLFFPSQVGNHPGTQAPSPFSPDTLPLKTRVSHPLSSA